MCSILSDSLLMLIVLIHNAQASVKDAILFLCSPHIYYICGAYVCTLINNYPLILEEGLRAPYVLATYLLLLVLLSYVLLTG
jgi:uncharacterized membrane protein